MTLFKGYCVASIGGIDETMPPVKLKNLEECVNYVMLHKKFFKEVIIEDNEEYVVLHASNGKVVHPKEIAEKFKDL